MGKYTVLSQIKVGGKLREVDEVIDLDDAIAAELRPGIVKALSVPAAAGKAPAPVLPPAPPAKSAPTIATKPAVGKKK